MLHIKFMEIGSVDPEKSFEGFYHALHSCYKTYLTIYRKTLCLMSLAASVSCGRLMLFSSWAGRGLRR